MTGDEWSMMQKCFRGYWDAGFAAGLVAGVLGSIVVFAVRLALGW